MTLARRLVLIITLATVIAFLGSLSISLLAARQYLTQQLTLKNADTAGALALSMSQSPKDPVLIELQVAALFDTGQYAEITVRRPDGQLLIEKRAEPRPDGTPDWFRQLAALAPAPGEAQVTEGWRQFARIHLRSQSEQATRQLWQTAWQLFLWCLAGGVLCALAGVRLARVLTAPLGAVVDQAEAVAERRFITLAEPALPELRSVVRAMNAMQARLQKLFDTEATRLADMQRAALLDPLTGLFRRGHFLQRLANLLQDPDRGGDGSLLLLRLAGLGDINQHHGHAAGDALLLRIARRLRDLAENLPGSATGRLNGADLALLLPHVLEPESHARSLLAVLKEFASAGLPEFNAVLAGTRYRHGETPAIVLARLDSVLANPDELPPFAWRPAPDSAPPAAPSHANWRALLEATLYAHRVRLARFPVATPAGAILHQEAMLRLQPPASEAWLAAGDFMPMASRLGMTRQLDFVALRLALAGLASEAGDLAINLAPESLLDTGWVAQVKRLLQTRPDAARRLWLEVAEGGALHHRAAFSHFCDSIRPLGCRLGIQHAGHRMQTLGTLHGMGLHYLKIDASLILGSEHDTDQRTLLSGLRGIAHNMGLLVIAEGVDNVILRDTLVELGLDGLTGPAISAPS